MYPLLPGASVPTPLRRTFTSSVALFVLLTALTPASAQEWSRFRGPNGTGIVPDAGYPIEFGPSRNLKWRSAARPGKSSPVLSRQHVFLTAYDEGALDTRCFDRETGRVLWERRETPARHDPASGLNVPSPWTP